MKNFFKVTLLLAFVATIPTAQSAANTRNPLPTEKVKPEVITSLKVNQNASEALTADWLSSCDEPYFITIFDITNGLPGITILPTQQNNGNTYTETGLKVGNTYLVTVEDCDSVVGETITITF